jgi:hypothetical protein
MSFQAPDVMLTDLEPRFHIDHSKFKFMQRYEFSSVIVLFVIFCFIKVTSNLHGSMSFGAECKSRKAYMYGIHCFALKVLKALTGLSF